MNTTTDSAINHYLTEYNRVNSQLVGHQLPWLQQLKNAALATLIAEGFPTLRHEDWKYTNVAPIIKQNFHITQQQAGHAIANIDITPFLPNEHALHRMVFIDGYFAPTLSAINNLPAGATINNLAQALAQDNHLVANHFNQLASQDDHAFKQLSTLFLQDGAFIHLTANTQLTQPIYLLFITTSFANASMQSLRNLIIAEENSHAHIIENYVSLNASHYFSNIITEAFLHPHAAISHYKLQQESQQAFHIGTLEVQQQTHSHFNSHSFALGGSLVRSDININLVDEHTACALNGLYLASGRQHIDHHTSIHHLKPHGTSREYYKGVVADRARAVFNGKVRVAQGAYKTDAQQSNKNLLLSAEAEIDTKPQLEIYADDVQCTHGAAIGQLNEDALFYLRARGINATQARNLLIYAFIQELFDQIPQTAIREQLLKNLSHFLPAQLAAE